MDQDDDRPEPTHTTGNPDLDAYIQQYGGHWGDSVSGGGVWIPATTTGPTPERTP